MIQINLSVGPMILWYPLFQKIDSRLKKGIVLLPARNASTHSIARFGDRAAHGQPVAGRFAREGPKRLEDRPRSGPKPIHDPASFALSLRLMRTAIFTVMATVWSVRLTPGIPPPPFTAKGKSAGHFISTLHP